MFTSTAKVYVRPAVTVVLPGSQGVSQQAAAATFTNTQMEVIKSETVLLIAGSLLDSQPELRGANVPTCALRWPRWRRGPIWRGSSGPAIPAVSMRDWVRLSPLSAWPVKPKLRLTG